MNDADSIQRMFQPEKLKNEPLLWSTGTGALAWAIRRGHHEIVELLKRYKTT